MVSRAGDQERMAGQRAPAQRALHRERAGDEIRGASDASRAAG
jgi:hypothetical protein